MDTTPSPFIPPAPGPRQTPPNLLQMFRIVYNNPIELWGEPSYNKPYVYIRSGIGGPLLVANDPDLIRHILVEKAKAFKMARVRQLILRPILHDGLLTAEGEVWKRSRKAMAPVFTPRHINGFAQSMLSTSLKFAERYEGLTEPFDMAHHMTEMTFEILAGTLFSGHIAGDPEDFSEKVEELFETAARVDPLDIIAAPKWIPRLTRIRRRKSLRYFRSLVKETVEIRSDMIEHGETVPDDFMTLLLRTEGDNGLTREEIEDNVITFFGAGHETTARALGWTFYLLAKAPQERAKVEQEIRRVVAEVDNPVEWLEAMIMPWTLHRHRKYWDDPDAFVPSRFLPQNREKLDKYQYLLFGAGPRICIGATFSLQEAVIAMGVLMSRYRFDMAPGAKEPWPVQKLTTQPEGGLQMVATPL